MNIFKHLISLILLLCGSVWATAANYRGDLNGDGKVDIADMVQWSKHMGASGSDVDPNFDLNGDGVLDDYDLDVIANLAINLKLTENSGFNVGIGGWNDSGEDFGGTVGGSSRHKASRSIEDFRFEGGKVTYDKATGNITRTIDIFGNESVIGVLVDIRLANGVNIDPKSITLSSDIISDHKIYGTPVIMDREWDDMQHFRFVIYSPSMSELNGDGAFFSFSYNKSPNSWDDSIQMPDCQAISKEDTSAFYYTSYYTGNWNFTPLNSIYFDEYVPSEGITLTVGEYRYMGLSFDPYEATNKEVECISTDESVAIFNMGWYGIETFSPGETIITICSKDEPDIYCSVKVIVQARVVKAEWIDIVASDFFDELHVGDSFTLNAIVYPDNATDRSVSWISDDESIAIINADGEVKIVGEGSTSIRAIANDGSNCEAVYFIYAIAGINDVINDTLPFSIFNISGYLMIDQASKEDLESLPSGVYILVQGSSISKILK